MRLLQHNVDYDLLEMINLYENNDENMDDKDKEREKALADANKNLNKANRF